ncbi:hypothetical protein BDF14DRAFT_334190 [Spinellus fusiger]|nr:hypothetical protein BDF14DRAFT_334190 [Spinellus fusiger]
MNEQQKQREMNVNSNLVFKSKNHFIAHPTNTTTRNSTIQHTKESQAKRCTSKEKSVHTSSPAPPSEADTRGSRCSSHDSDSSRTQPIFFDFFPNLSPQVFQERNPNSGHQGTYKVNGVNILNRKNLDSKVAIERLEKRRENHNHIERRRRDIINTTIFEISKVVPHALDPSRKPKRSHILKLALAYIQELQNENTRLNSQLQLAKNEVLVSQATDSLTQNDSIFPKRSFTGRLRTVHSCSSLPTLPSLTLVPHQHQYQHQHQHQQYQQYSANTFSSEREREIYSMNPNSMEAQKIPLPTNVSNTLLPFYTSSHVHYTNTSSPVLPQHEPFLPITTHSIHRTEPLLHQNYH